MVIVRVRPPSAAFCPLRGPPSPGLAARRWRSSAGRPSWCQPAVHRYDLDEDRGGGRHGVDVEASHLLHLRREMREGRCDPPRELQGQASTARSAGVAGGRGRQALSPGNGSVGGGQGTDSGSTGGERRRGSGGRVSMRELLEPSTDVAAEQRSQQRRRLLRCRATSGCSVRRRTSSKRQAPRQPRNNSRPPSAPDTTPRYRAA